MKPKLSSGYLTPQANRLRRVSTPTRSESNDELNTLNNVNESFFEKLMSCPIKRQLILELISSEKENIKKYKRKQAEEQKRKQCNGSPFAKVQKKHQCESPTALFRRRALEQQSRQSPVNDKDNQSDIGGSRSSSRQSVSSSSASPILFNALLDGVIAYVEIRSKNKEDRSSGAKALLRSMGAVVKDQFTKDVTHVIFKDGLYTTYQKAKLMKIHLVSVLWVEAVRSTNMKVSEKKFPALGTEAYDHNVSSLCSQMQKDYEEIIREEVRLSLATGTPLPSTRSLIDRRRTMTPFPSTSSQLSQGLPSTQDREVEGILKSGRKSDRKTFNYGISDPVSIRLSPELTDDDSDLGLCVNGSIVNKNKYFAEDEVILNSIENLQDPSNMELTDIENSECVPNLNRRETLVNKDTSESNMEITTVNGQSIIDESITDGNQKNDSDSNIYNKQTPKLSSRKSSKNIQQKLSEDRFSVPDDSLYRRQTRQLRISLTPCSNSVLQRDSSQIITANNAPEPGCLKILSKNSCGANTKCSETPERNSSTIPHLLLSSCKSNVEKSTSSSMSSLQITSELNGEKRKQSRAIDISDKSTSTNMSALVVSSDSSKGHITADSNINPICEGLNKKATKKISLSKMQDRDAIRTSSDSTKEKGNFNAEKSTSTNMSSLQITSDSNEEKPKQNKAIDISDKSTSTNMSALIISSDSSKGHITADSNINPVGEGLNKKATKKTSLSKIKENSFTSMGDNSFSPLNVNTMKEVLQILDNNVIPDENVTRRRRGRPRKSILPSSSKGDNLSPPKQAKETEKGKIDIGDNRQKALREKLDNTDKLSLPVVSRKTLGLRRKTILPFHPNVEETIPCKDLPEGSSPPKKVKNERHSMGSVTGKSNSEESSNKRTLRNKQRPVDREEQSSAESKSEKNNKATSDESDTCGSEKKRRMRKLYNPDDSLTDDVVSDEQERENKRIEVKKRKSNEGVILNPAVVTVASTILLTAKAKEFIERNKIDLQTVLNKESESEDDKTSRKKGRRKKKKDKRVSVNSDADEQKNLAEEFLNKKKEDNVKLSAKQPVAKSEGRIVKRRQSVRLSQHPRKTLKFDASSSSSDEKKSVPKTPNRRSTLEFQPLSQRSEKKKLKVDKSKQPRIVCTRLHKDDIQVFGQIVRKLGGFVIEDEVSDKTTHLVAGEPKRTVNMLRAVARGCWVVRHEWLLKSLEEGKWLPEEDYEETEFSSAVQKCRLQRQALGQSFSMNIFKDCGPIYIARGSNPRCSDLRELVSLCKGKVVTITRNATIVVGEYVRHEGVKCVKETWLLDSIQFNRKMPFKRYIITSGTDSPHV